MAGIYANSIEEIILPSNLYSISSGTYCSFKCYNGSLKKITIPQSIAGSERGMYYVFGSSYEKITDVSFSGTVTSIGK